MLHDWSTTILIGMEISLRIVLRKPTAGVDFGLQKGRGSKYEVVQKQRSAGKDLEFEFSVGVKTDKDGAPDFSGPFVQGPRGDRYFYIDIGTYAGQTDSCWSRRLKIPLEGVPGKMIRTGGVFQGRAGTAVRVAPLSKISAVGSP